MWVTVQLWQTFNHGVWIEIANLQVDKKILKDKIAYAHSVNQFCQEYHDKVVNKYCIFKEQTQVYLINIGKRTISPSQKIWA